MYEKCKKYSDGQRQERMCDGKYNSPETEESKGWVKKDEDMGLDLGPCILHAQRACHCYNRDSLCFAKTGDGWVCYCPLTLERE